MTWQCKDLKTVLKEWEQNKNVWSIERGGLGPSYEQLIQIGIFELSKELIGKQFPEDCLNAYEINLKIIKFKDRYLIDYLSGAQYYEIIRVVSSFIKIGYSETLLLAQKNGAKLIQVNKEFV